MRKRLVFFALLITVAAVVILGVPLGFAGSRLIRSSAQQRLDRDANAIAGAIEDHIEQGRPITAAVVDRVAPPDLQVSVTTQGGKSAHGTREVAPPRLVAQAVTDRGAVVDVAGPAGEVDEKLREVWLIVGGLAIAGILAGGGLALLQAKRLAGPLDLLAATSRRLGGGDFSARAAAHGIGEIDAVGDALNHSAEQIAELLGAERRFATAVSHQLRTPLTAMRLRLEEIEAVGDPPVQAEARAALKEVVRLTQTIDDLLNLTQRGSRTTRTALDLSKVVQEHAATWRAQLARTGRTIALNVSGDCIAMASSGAVGQALDVLVDNAIKHGGTNLRVEVARDDGRLTIAVEDDGRGVEESLQETIFEWDTSTGGGLGIGLPLARALIEADGGRLRLRSAHPASFEISLPLAPEP